MMRTRRKLIWSLVLALVALPGLVAARDLSPQQEDALGKQGAAEIEREYGVLKDPEQEKRIDAILKAIGPATERPEVVYRAKILKTPEVNALSLPGGYIYVTKGLLDAVECDDELAGVLAHEIAHNAHKHAIKQMEKSNKFDQQMLLGVLAMILVARDKVDAGQLLLLGQVLKMSALSGYGQAAELEADSSAVSYLIKAKRYNPVGVLQFMETLRRDEGRRPLVEPFFRSHPPTPIRVQELRDQLTENGIEIVRLPGKNTPIASARTVAVNGKQVAEVVMRDQVLFQPAAPADEKDPLARAEQYAQQVSAIFREYAEERYLRIRPEGDARVLFYRDKRVIVITPEDARFHNTTTDELAARAAKAIRKIIWEDFLRRTI